MSIIEMIVLSMALSIDSFTIGISCGFGGIKMSVAARGIIFVVSSAVTCGAVVFGRLLSGIVPELVGKLAGAGLLAVLGIYMIWSALRERRDEREYERADSVKAAARILSDPERCDADSSKTIEPYEALTIGIALSADSFAAGISAGISSLSALLVPIFCGVFQMALLYIGERTALRIKGFCPKKRIFSVCSGAILLITAVFRVIL